MERYPSQPEEIGSFEAKVHLSELLRETEHGRSYLITRRGKPVARLLPAQDPAPADFNSLLAQFDALRARVRGKVSVKKLIEEGRR